MGVQLLKPTKSMTTVYHNLQVACVWLASSPGLLRGEGEGRPGIHCMRMRYIFRIIYRKSARTLILTTCWQVKRSMCLKNTEWPPDLCTSDHAKRVPTLFRGLCRSMNNVARATSKSRSNFELSKPTVTRYVEHDALRSKGKYTRQYPYVIGLFRIWIITAHAHAVDTRPSFPLPPQKAWGRG